ncbi:MAG: hypothetical protein KBC84_03260, partial [Proteobacteria bacterium]|nr:hypothetical protein [Pseudomonadota bacterium]
INAQNQQLTCLEAQKPEFVVWDSDSKVFDNVPNLVRVPLIYNYIVENYEPEISYRNLHILKRKSENSNFNWEFWNKTLGQELDLGVLPWVSDYTKLNECAGNNNCVSFAILNKSTQSKTIAVDIGERRFTVKVNRPLNAAYDESVSPAIFLDRIWFYQQAQRQGMNIRISDPSTSQELKIDRRSQNYSFLY